jgi:hypothetical protein
MLKNLFKRVPEARRPTRVLGFTPRQSDRREFLLKTLPKNSVCAEIGVHKGDFSAQILRTVDPKELHLVDPWKYVESDTYKETLYGGKIQGGQAEMDERYHTLRLRFEPDIRSGRVKIHRGYSGNVLAEFPDGYLIGCTSTVITFTNLSGKILSFPSRKLNPVDTSLETTTGRWLVARRVKKAVDQFVQEKPVQLVTIRNSQFILRK